MSAQDEATPLGLTFVPTTCDLDKAAEACLRLASIAKQSDEWDSDEIGEVLALATEAFPGLQEFVNRAVEDELDCDTVTIGLSALPDDCDASYVAAAAELAIVGALAEVSEGFEWDDVERAAESCTIAVSSIPEQAAPPGLR